MAPAPTKKATTPAARTRKPAAKKPAAKKPAAKPAATKSTAKPAATKSTAKPAARKPAAKKPAARKPAAKRTTARKPTAAQLKGTVDRSADLSDEVLESVASGQRAAIEAVRKFIEAVDEALPVIGDRPSRRETVVDAALEMADKLVTTQYDFLRSVVRSADRTLGDAKPAKK